MRRYGRFGILLVAFGVSAVLAVGVSGAAGSVQARWQVTVLRLPAGWAECSVVALNERAEVVGSCSRDGNPDHAFLWRDAKPIDVGALAGLDTRAVAINARGQVVGVAERYGGSDTHNPAETLTFVWESGRMIKIGDSPGMPSPPEINDRGQVVGETGGKSKRHAFLWNNGQTTNLGKFSPVALNSRGQVLGWTGKTVLWTNGKTRILGSSFDPWAMNGRGQVVGQSGPWPREHAILWDKGKITDLHSGPQSEPVAINDRGQVIIEGFANSGEGLGRGLVWQQGRLTNLGGYSSGVAAINESGQVVGDISLTKSLDVDHAFVWQDGHMTLLTRSGTGSSAVAINDHGQIIGWIDKGGIAQPVLWTQH